ncbi:MAG TPA: ABC transporter ATP-binding protein [Mobilitalea sp.]|nr:ABC transporter ATP-binding protein [Mobilitalea sp.]
MDKTKDILLSCRNLSKSYENGTVITRVLKNINLDFYEGTISLIYGKSGSGKTTLLNLLAALDQPSNGEIYFRDKAYKSMTDSQLSKLRGNNYGFVFQAYHLIGRISVEENIKCPGYINGRQLDMNYFNYLVDSLDIRALLNKMPNQISGGEQQRVAIARAMILKPSIVFADEPTGNLDSINTGIIIDVFKNLNKRYGTTFIIVTHEEDLIDNCDQVIRLKDGEILIEKSQN